MTDGRPAPGFAVDAPRPPTGFSIDLPDHWTVLDLDPRTQDAWLEAFLDARLADRSGVQAERGPARGALRELLRRLHEDGVFLAAVLAADVDGQPVSASATLAWRHPDLGADRIDVEGLRQVFVQAPAGTGEEPTDRRVERIELPSGPAVKVVTKETAPVPTLAKVRLVAVTQYLVPGPEDGWLAVITATTGVRELEAGVEAVADAMARTLRFQTDRALPKDEARSGTGRSRAGPSVDLPGPAAAHCGMVRLGRSRRLPGVTPLPYLPGPSPVHEVSPHDGYGPNPPPHRPSVGTRSAALS